MLEKEIESYLIKRIKEINGLSYKWLSTVTGVPDRILIHRGKVHLVEVKTAKGVLSARQSIVFNEIMAKGVSVAIVKSKSDVENLIDNMLKM